MWEMKETANAYLRKLMSYNSCRASTNKITLTHRDVTSAIVVLVLQQA